VNWHCSSGDDFAQGSLKATHSSLERVMNVVMRTRFIDLA